MNRLFMAIFALTGPTFAGSLVVAALTMGLDTLQPILVAAGVGFVAALPVTWIITKNLTS